MGKTQFRKVNDCHWRFACAEYTHSVCPIANLCLSRKPTATRGSSIFVESFGLKYSMYIYARTLLDAHATRSRASAPRGFGKFTLFVKCTPRGLSSCLTREAKAFAPRVYIYINLFTRYIRVFDLTTTTIIIIRVVAG